MKKILYIIPVLIIIFSACQPRIKSGVTIQNKQLQNQQNEQEVSFALINDVRINLEVARKKQEMAKGLSNREILEKNNGMLFVFEEKKIQDFWMKNMRFPLDIIWIEDDKIAGIAENLAPEGEAPVNHYYSPIPVNYVLEVNGGFCEENNIKAGDRVEFK